MVGICFALIPSDKSAPEYRYVSSVLPSWFQYRHTVFQPSFTNEWHGTKELGLFSFTNSCYQKKLPELITQTLSKENDVQLIARDFLNAKGTMYLGRGYSYPVAMEGALKLKELSYIHAEGYAAGEMKHGPLALIEDGLPVIVLSPKDRYFEKTISNTQEVVARGGKVIMITDDTSTTMSENIRFKIQIPKTNSMLNPFLLTIPIQFLAYHVALLKNCNIDKPRNLAKSVTVE